MAAELAQIKDIYMDNLRKVMERGEKLEDLQAKTADLRTHTVSYKKKAKKLNSWWGWLCPAACGGNPNAHSSGLKDDIKTAQTAARLMR